MAFGKKKGPGEDLEPTLKEALDGMSAEELRTKLSEVALYRQAQEDTKKSDPDVQQKRDALKLATADYNEQIKGAKKQVSYIKYLLEQAGKL